MKREALLIGLALFLIGGIILYNVFDAPKANPVTVSVATAASTATERALTININTASVDEIKVLLGIGTAKAEAIVAYRIENGDFLSADELLRVPGIGEKILQGIEPYIVF